MESYGLQPKNKSQDFSSTTFDNFSFLEVSHPTINGILKRLEEKKFITTEMTKKRRTPFKNSPVFKKRRKHFN